MRYWNVYDVRSLCIAKNYYTSGSNEAYSRMLNFVADSEPTDENIHLVALDICFHTPELDAYNKECVTMVEYELLRKICR